MGIFSPEGESHHESVVFFLSESLRAAIEAGDLLQQSVCEAPQFVPGMDAENIADQLAHFRHKVGDLWGLEMLLLTKILRAADLAKELRLLDSELKPEIDTFRLATVMAQDLRDMLLPDADMSFNGALQPKQFLESRGYRDFNGTTARDRLIGYKVAGQLDVRLLLDACETLHFCLAGRYGVEAQPLLLNLEDEELLEDTLIDDSEDCPFLLSDFGEIVSDDTPLSQQGWHQATADQHGMRH